MTFISLGCYDIRRNGILAAYDLRQDAAQLAAEADKPPDAAPAGRAGWCSARRTASRRLHTLNVNCLCIAASGAPLVRSRVGAACSLTSDPLDAPECIDRGFQSVSVSSRMDARGISSRRADRDGQAL